ncbi:helix-turn-helix domain-containing protein [Limosilactobacillus ingluviei]
MNENEQQLQIGQRLKEARVAKGYTLDDLQQATKIQKRYLIAIEDENFGELPGDFYVRAFVKQYADTVGLDGNELLKDYDDYLPKTKTTEYSEHLSQAVETRRGSHRVTTDGFDQARKYIPTVIVGAIVVIILGAIWATTIIKNRADSATKIDSSSVSVSGESSHAPKKAASSKPKAKSQKLKFKETSRTTTSVVYTTSQTLSKDTKLTIKAANTAVYAAVNVDNVSQLAKTLSAKETGTVTLSKTAKRIVITLGSGNGVTIKLGNQTLNFTNDNQYPSTRVITLSLGNSTTQTSATTSSSTATTNQTNRTTTTTGTTSTGQTTQRTTTTSTSTPTTTTQTTTSTTTPAATTNNQTTAASH